MAVLRVQSAGPTATTNGASGSGHSATWGTTTSSGNLLVAVWTFRSRGTAPTALAPPSGWSIATEPSSFSTSHNEVAIYYIAGAAARSGAEAFTWSGGTTMDGTVTLLEYSGVQASGALDLVARNDATQTTNPIASGTTGTSSQAQELFVGATANNGLGTQTLNTAGYTEVGRVHTATATGTHQNEGLVAERISSVQETAGFDSDAAPSFGSGAGAIATFKSSSGGTVHEAAAILSAIGTVVPAPTATYSVSAVLSGAGSLAAAAAGTTAGLTVTSSITGRGLITTQIGGGVDRQVTSEVSEDASVGASGHRETALKRVQSSEIQTVNSASSISASWPASTTTGSLLLAVVGVVGGEDVFESTFVSTFGQPDPEVSAPSGWTLLTETKNAGDVVGQVYYIANAASRSGGDYSDTYSNTYESGGAGEVFTFSVARDAALQLIEVSGAAVAPLDLSATSSGDSSFASTGFTGTTTQADEYWFGFLVTRDSSTVDEASGGFVVIDQASSSSENSNQRVTLATLEAFSSTESLAGTTAQLLGEASSGGGYSSGYTAGYESGSVSEIPVSRAWAGAIATFKVSVVSEVGHSAAVSFQTTTSLTAAATPVGVNTAVFQTLTQFRASATPTTVVVVGGGTIVPVPDEQETAVLLSQPVVSYDFSEVRNVIEVLGAKPEKGIKRIRAVARARKDHPLSPWSLARNGDPRYIVETIETGIHPRTKVRKTGTEKKGDGKPYREETYAVHESVVKRKRHAQEIADRELKERLQAHVEVTFDCLPQPHLEPGDKVLLRSETAGRVEFRLKKFSLPLGSGSAESVGVNKRLSFKGKRKRKRTQHARANPVLRSFRTGGR